MKTADLFDLTGKVALVSGANQGLGLGAARAYAEAGAAVAIWGRTKERNAEAAAELEALGAEVWADAVDVAEPDQVAAGYERVVDRLGRVDSVFVNAGIFHNAASFADLTFDDYRRLLRVNMDGGFLTMHGAVEHMIARAESGDPGGSIVVNGSLSVWQGVIGMEHYGAAKGGLASMVKGIAVECGRFGIRANMICPGFFNRERPESEEGDEKSRILTAKIQARCPIPRMGEASDLAGILVYLASDASKYHTGDIITIDGGWMAVAL